MEFYLKIEEIVSPFLREVLNEIRVKNTIPLTWREAIITIIPKQELDPKDIKNYRPISLINSNYKIFANILATRLKKVLNHLIHQDQTGFLPKRHMRSNVRIILNVSEYYEEHPEKQAAILFIDAEKAFDNVCWEFMEEQLEEMLGEGDFVDMLSTIYKEQKARILINGELTGFIQIYRGTRQGCPLSPLLFIATLEILNNNIRENEEIRRLKVKGQ